jgi:hypothetical protein
VSANDAFLDLMEAYFGRSDEQKAPVARPELAYQVMLIHSVCTDKVCVGGGLEVSWECVITRQHRAQR